jgi:SAM-dependent methyltransferase
MVPRHFSLHVPALYAPSPTSAQEAATAYDALGAEYRDYADGDSGRLFDFESRYGFADREVWARIDAALMEIRERRRHALRILDVGCGPGTWLLRAVLRARELGFTAIEGHGIDVSREMVALARTAAAEIDDPAIGLTFDVSDLRAALVQEEAGDCDIVLCLYGVLNHLPGSAHAEAAAGLARATGAALILTVRAAGSLPSIFVAGVEQAARFHQDHARERLEVDLRDGRHIEFDSHLFHTRELRELFARHCTIRELVGLDIFHSRFARDPHWNPPGNHGPNMARRLRRLERLCADDPVMMDSAAHLLLVAEPKDREPRR